VADGKKTVLLSADGTVTELPQPPVTEIQHAAAFEDGTIVVVGTGKDVAKASCFYPERMAWSTFWTPALDPSASCVVANNRMYVIGGESRKCWSLYVIGGESRKCAWSLGRNADELAWSPLPDAPSIRKYASAVVVENRIFVLGGMPFTSSVDVLNLVTREWLEPQWPKATDGSIGLHCYNAAAVAVSVFATPEHDDEDKTKDPTIPSPPAKPPKAALKRPRDQSDDSERD
jgi:hypothetical protein